MKEKKITIRVSEATYSRWKAAALADKRTISGWLCCRAEGMVSKDPLPETIITKEETNTSTKASIFSLDKFVKPELQ